MLFKQSLEFFCRVDKLEDRFEGTSYQTNFEAEGTGSKANAKFRSTSNQLG